MFECKCPTFNSHIVSDHCPEKKPLTKEEFDKLKKKETDKLEFRGD